MQTDKDRIVAHVIQAALMSAARAWTVMQANDSQDSPAKLDLLEKSIRQYGNILVPGQVIKTLGVMQDQTIMFTFVSGMVLMVPPK